MDVHVRRDQIVDGTLVKGLRQLEGEDVLLGTVLLFGLSCHVFFIKVAVDEGGEQYPIRDPNTRWEVLAEAEPEGVFQTTEVPGFEGKWAFYITPFMR